MKKKHRDITVDNVQYGWITNGQTLRIFLDKKVVFAQNFGFETFTPGLVAKIIKDGFEYIPPPRSKCTCDWDCDSFGWERITNNECPVHGEHNW